MLVGALVLTPLAGSLAAVSTGAPAGATGTAVIAETFTNANVSSPSSWVTPPGPGGATNAACLTAGTATSQEPIPDCSATGGDTAGNGVLQLTTPVTSQEGGTLISASVPASNGLDATFNTYQWGGTGADGISFVIAAEAPGDPVAPTQIGEPGGDLGYSAAAGSEGGLADGYLGVGLDVYGNYSNPTFNGGSGCPSNYPVNPSWADEQMPGQVVVRGPGNGTAGYCPLDSSANGDAGSSQDLDGSTRAGSLVPVEVVLNTTSASVDMSGSRFTTNSVPAGDYGVAWVPIGGPPEFYTGALPSTANGGIPSSLYPSGWINPATGIPYQLGFGWVGSTGAATDYHQVSNVSVTTLQPVPVLSAAITDSDNGQLPPGGTVDYALQAGVTSGGGEESNQITMTATLPGGVTPGSAAASGGWACSTAGQVVTCAYGGSYPVAAGTTLPSVSLPAAVAAGITTGTSLDSSVTVSSDDGNPATATDDGKASPPSLTSVTLAAGAAAAAGIGTIPLDNNGALPTETQQSQVLGTASGSSNDTANNQVAGLAIGNIAVKNIAVKNIAVKNIAVKNIALKNIATEVAIPGQDPLADISLSNINVTYPDGCDPTAVVNTTNACTGWEGILAGSQYASWPLQSVTLGDVLNTTGQDQPDNLNPEGRLDSLNLGDLDLSGSSLGSIPVTAYVLGSASIADVPLSPSDEPGEATVSDWCTQMAGLNISRLTCSALGIDPTNPSTYENVTPLALGILGVPLSSLSLTSIPVDTSDVDNSPLDSIAVKNIAVKNIAIGNIAVKNIAVKNIAVGNIAVKNIAVKNIGLGNVAVKNIAVKNIGLGNVAVKNIAVKNIGLGNVAVKNIAVKNIALGNLPLVDFDVDDLAVKNIAVKNIATPSDIVNCAVIDCTGTSTATVGSAYDAGELASGATLALLQQDAGTDPAFALMVLSDLYTALTANGNLDADSTTLADMYAALTAAGLASDTTTLADLYGAINPTGLASDTTTLADIYGALTAAGLASDTTTLADLYGAIDPNDDTTTLGQLIDDLAANDPSDLTGVFLGDLVAGLLPESSYPWQDVDLDTPGLAQASTGGGELTLTATSTTAGSGALIDYSFTLPVGFSYVPGSATYDGATVGDPQVTDSSTGATVTSSDFSVSGTGTDTYAISVAPGESLGAQGPSVTAGLNDGSTQTASTSVNVTDPFATTNAASPATLTPDTMNVSFLASPNTPAYWNINLTTAGNELSLDLSNLPADYDLVLYGPATSSLSGAPSGDTAEVTETPPADQSTLGQQTDPDEGTIPLLPNLPIEAISATRGLGDEQITTPPLAAGLYTAEVSGYNGAYSTAQPYVLRDEVTPSSPTPSCSVPPTYANDTPTLGETLPTSYPPNVNTLFLVDPDRLLEAYGAGGSGAATPGEQDVMSALQNITSHDVNGMIGAVVPVEGSTQTAQAYEAWDASPCSVSAANSVESDINQTVRSIEAANPTVRNIVIVGADDSIPMARIPDQTTSDNESSYGQDEFAGINDQLSAALSQGYFLSDDPYGSPTPLLVGGQELYTPSLAVGRLVETPTEIINALDRYVKSGGVLNANSALSTGYDFLSQGATAISNALKSDGEKVTNVISDDWDNTDLLDAMNGTASGEGAPNIQSINAHFDFGRVLTAQGDQPGNNDPTQVLQTTDVRAATAPTSTDPNDALLGSVLFSMGCHSGLNIPDNEIENDVPGGLDTWAKTFADEGALWIGNTGYGYANDQYISYSAKLMGLFSANLNGTLDVGEALAQAKQLYVGQSATLDPFDLKSMMESTFYGIPNYTLDGPVSAPTTGSLPRLQLGLDTNTDLTTDSFSVSGQTPGSGPSQLGEVTPPEGGSYYEVNDSTLEETAVGFPIEPLNSIDVTDPGVVAHGALITGLSSLDYDNFTPSVAQSDSDTSDDANQVSSLETAFPATLQQVSSYDLFDPTSGDPVPHQAVNVITGQYIPNPNDPEQGNQRLFTNVAGSVEYTSPGDTQFTPPTVDQAEGVVTGGQVNFSVVASSPVQGTTVKEVLVLFKDATAGGDAATGTSVNWTPVWLSQGSDGSWSGGAPASSSGQVSFIVQAVDSDGNVAMSSNKGVDFTQVPAVQSTGSGLSGAVTSGNPETDGYYTTSPVTETLTGPATGTPITYSVDGGPTATAASPVPVSLSGDGTHTITATDPEGDTTTQTVGIETQNPTIDTLIAAPQSGNNWTSGGTTLTISASAPSGVRSLTYTVTPQGGTPGQPQSVTNGSVTVNVTANPPAGTTAYAVTATSFAGHTTTKTVTTNVDVTAPSVSCTPSPVPTAWQDTQGTVTCTASDNQSGVAGPNPITLSTSVASGTPDATAQTNAAQVCDNVGNCTTVGPFTFKVDLTTPVVTASVSAPKSANGYDGPGTVIDANASDGASGLSSFTYTVTPAGGTAGPSVTVPSSGQIPVTQSGTFTFTATSVAGATKTASVTVSLDLTPPSVSCSKVPTGWQTANVTITCSASDPLVGVPTGTNPITLSTTVAAGTSNATAQTNSKTVCDNVGNCTTVGPFTFKVDLTTPVVTASVSAPKSANGYDGPGTVIDTSASDSGSGLSSFTYTVTPAGGTAGPSVTVPSSGQIPVTQAGTFTYTFTAASVAGQTKTTSVKVSVDLTPPSVSCSKVPTGWQTANVTITCSASDPLVGVPTGTNPITLSTTVAAGTSNATAQTNSKTVCDNVGNCTTAGPIKGIEVDLTAPSVSLPAPTNGEVFELDQPATPSFTCSDTGGSGIKACTAKVGTAVVTSGGPLPTSAVGVYTLTVTATSVAGVTVTKSTTYDVTYNLCNVAVVPAPPLSEVTFALSVCTYNGTNVGSASIAVTAMNVDGTTTPKGVLGSHFIWIPAPKAYTFLLLTTNLTKGSHTLNMSITGDPLGHAVPFKVS